MKVFFLLIAISFFLTVHLFAADLNLDLCCSDSSSQRTPPTDSISRIVNSKQSDSARLKVTPLRIFSMAGENLVDQATSPFKMDESDITHLLIAAGITGGLLFIDDPFDETMHRIYTHNKFIRNSANDVTDLGGQYGIIGSALFAGYSLVFNDKKSQETSLLLGEALLTSAIWDRIGKLVIGRERPSYSRHNDQSYGGHWHEMSGNLLDRFRNPAEYDSFPSGHSTEIFAIATVVANQYDDVHFVPEISYGVATIVGLSRILNRTHWASDVFVGGCLGYICAKQVIANYHRSYDPIAGSDVAMGVSFNGTPMVSLIVNY